MISNLKELEKFFKLCQKQGIKKADLNAMSFEFGEIPGEKSVQNEEQVQVSYDNFPEGVLTPEQLMFYSSGGVPDNDPFLKDH